MADEEDVLLREVDEDLSRDQTFERLEKWRVPLIGGAVAILAGVTGWQVMGSRQEQAAAAAASAYAPLSFAAEGEVSPADLSAFADEFDGGYATLASLRAAAALGAQGDLEGARDLYQAIYDDPASSVSLRDYARIRTAYLLFDRRTNEAADLAALVETTAFRPFAEEIAATAALKNGQYAAALAGFKSLANSPTAPQTISARASAYALVADAALNGAVITPSQPEETPASFIERLGSELGSSGVPIGGSDLPPLPNLDILTDGIPAPDEAPEAVSDEGQSQPGDNEEDTP